MNWQMVAFFVLSTVILVSAWKVVTCRLITHSALCLALAFVGVAGIFLLLAADFLAAVQVLVYVGAVITMIIFAIMLSNIRDIKDTGEAGGWPGAFTSPQWGLLPLVVAVGFALIMISLYGRGGWPLKASLLAQPSTVAIGREMFTTYLIPFELASVILLAAMVGAIIISMREDS